MIRTQIQLHDDQARRLREIAAAEEVSLAEMIRRGVDMVLESSSELTRRDRLDALRVAGSFDSGLPHVAERHDDELAEAYLGQ
ncbi:MAG TPA: ribbon-helix-helix protein, CopG family [Thermoleophilia bacterium]|nr:ribbon-helix-helix protein, CopG family [Thermoleophilia bacterium]